MFSKLPTKADSFNNSCFTFSRMWSGLNIFIFVKWLLILGRFLFAFAFACNLWFSVTVITIVAQAHHFSTVFLDHLNSVYRRIYGYCVPCIFSNRGWIVCYILSKWISNDFRSGKTLEVGREGKLVFIYRVNICLEVNNTSSKYMALVFQFSLVYFRALNFRSRHKHETAPLKTGQAKAPCSMVCCTGGKCSRNIL